MKKQECSQLFVAIVPFLCAFLFAFLLWRYLRQPEPDTDRLTVAITYTNYNFNTITPLPEMECAIDKNFSKRLRQMSSCSDLDLGAEEYTYQIDTIPKVIYITPLISIFSRSHTPQRSSALPEIPRTITEIHGSRSAPSQPKRSPQEFSISKSLSTHFRMLSLL